MKTLPGTKEVKFSFPNNFAVKYDSSITTKAELLALEVFAEYPAEVTDEVVNFETKTASSGSCCGGTGGCGGTCSGSCGGY